VGIHQARRHPVANHEVRLLQEGRHLADVMARKGAIALCQEDYVGIGGFQRRPQAADAGIAVALIVFLDDACSRCHRSGGCLVGAIVVDDYDPLDTGLASKVQDGRADGFLLVVGDEDRTNAWIGYGLSPRLGAPQPLAEPPLAQDEEDGAHDGQDGEPQYEVAHVVLDEGKPVGAREGGKDAGAHPCRNHVAGGSHQDQGDQRYCQVDKHLYPSQVSEEPAGAFRARRAKVLMKGPR